MVDCVAVIVETTGGWRWSRWKTSSRPSKH